MFRRSRAVLYSDSKKKEQIDLNKVLLEIYWRGGGTGNGVKDCRHCQYEGRKVGLLSDFSILTSSDFDNRHRLIDYLLFFFI